MNKAQFYVLCAHNGKPIALIRVRHREVVEVGGKNAFIEGARYNIFPVEHMPMIGRFIDANCFDVGDNHSQTGFIRVGGRLKSLFDIRPDDPIERILDLRRVSQFVNVEGMSIRGSFDMSGARWTHIPNIRADEIWAVACPNLSRISDDVETGILHVDSYIHAPSVSARIDRVFFYSYNVQERRSVKTGEMTYAQYRDVCVQRAADLARGRLPSPPPLLRHYGRQ